MKTVAGSKLPIDLTPPKPAGHDQAVCLLEGQAPTDISPFFATENGLQPD